MKRLFSVEVRGREKLWGFPFKGDPKHLEEWRADGLTVDVIENTIPLWAQQMRLTHVWCRVQDAWNWMRLW
jgi:hypothetical protein